MNRSDLKVIFMGTPDFAKESLKALVENGFNVLATFTNPDSKSGRGLETRISPVKEYAIARNIPIFQPEKIRNNIEVIEAIKSLKPDVICVTAYGKILPKELLEIPKYGCINVHGSLLPKYRGAAPIQWAIINGENITGITTMYMDEGMDTGDMLLKEEVPIEENDNYSTLHDKLKIIGARLLVKTLDKVLDDSLIRQKQPDNATYAPMIDKEISKLDFSLDAKSVYNLVRGLSPFLGTYFLDKNAKRYKVYEVKYIKNDDSSSFENGQIAYINKDTLGIKCRDGFVEIVVIQPESSKKMLVSEFLKTNKFVVGDKLS